MRFFVFLLTCLFLALPSWAAPSDITGLWQTKDKDAIVEIYSCGTHEYCGRFHWLKDDSAENPSLDNKNPKKELRSRPLCGLTFLGGFEEEGSKLDSGWIYSPRHGAKFSARMKLLDPDHLELRGYFLFSFLGDSQIWTRIKNAPACHAIEGKEKLHP